MSDTPRTDGKVCKCLDMLEAEACWEYVSLCRTLELELAHARELLANANRGAEVNAKANQLLAEQLAEARQERYLLKRMVDVVVSVCVENLDCGRCPVDSGICWDNPAICKQELTAWAAQQAKEGGGK